MEIQRIFSFLRSLPGIVAQFTAFQKLAILFAFLGSFSLGYGLYVQLHPVEAIVPDGEVVSLEENFPANAAEVATPEAIAPSLAIDVSGAVVHPGVYLLAKGERVSDAVSQAGGFAKKADKGYINKSINLAQTVQDAMKIYIPYEGEENMFTNAPVTSQQPLQATTTTQTRLNINTATVTQLDELKGIGAARAQQIVDNRPYTDLADFSAKSGLSQTLVDQLSSSISF